MRPGRQAPGRARARHRTPSRQMPPGTLQGAPVPPGLRHPPRTPLARRRRRCPPPGAAQTAAAGRLTGKRAASAAPGQHQQPRPALPAAHQCGSSGQFEDLSVTEAVSCNFTRLCKTLCFCSTPLGMSPAHSTIALSQLERTARMRCRVCRPRISHTPIPSLPQLTCDSAGFAHQSLQVLSVQRARHALHTDRRERRGPTCGPSAAVAACVRPAGPGPHKQADGAGHEHRPAQLAHQQLGTRREQLRRSICGAQTGTLTRRPRGFRTRASRTHRRRRCIPWQQATRRRCTPRCLQTLPGSFTWHAG